MSLLQPGRARSAPLVVLGLASLVSFGSFAAVPHDSFHPLAQMACLLPLQLAALLFAWQAGRR